jgi:hypothetical protein
MFLGRFHLGDTVCIPLTANTSAGVPTSPDAVPGCIVYDSSNVVQAVGNMPMVDRYGLAGLAISFFMFPLFLGSEFAAGNYRALKVWAITDPFAEEDTFEVATAGNKDGPGLGLGQFSVGELQNVLMTCASGRVKKLRNPRAL